MNIFDMLEDAAKGGKNIAVDWRYDKDNDVIREYGEEFKEDAEYLIFTQVSHP